MNSYDKRTEDEDIIVEIPGVESQSKQFNKYGEVIFQDKVRVSKIALNNAFFRKIAGLSIKFRMIQRERKIRRLNMIIDRNKERLTGNIVDLENLKAQRRIIDERNHLSKEIEAQKKLKAIVENSFEKGRQK